MKFLKCDVAGAWVIDPTPHPDERGRFMRAWCKHEFADHGIDFTPVQANMGLSLQCGTIRGLHYQLAPALEAKLVRCTRGSIYDVVVDLRPEFADASTLVWSGVERRQRAHVLCAGRLCAWLSVDARQQRNSLHDFGLLCPGAGARNTLRRSRNWNTLAAASLRHFGAG